MQVHNNYNACALQKSKRETRMLKASLLTFIVKQQENEICSLHKHCKVLSLYFFEASLAVDRATRLFGEVFTKSAHRPDAILLIFLGRFSLSAQSCFSCV